MSAVAAFLGLILHPLGALRAGLAPGYAINQNPGDHQSYAGPKENAANGVPYRQEARRRYKQSREE